MTDQYIVGLNIANHDSSAALLKNGELITYAEQERFSRNKLAIGEAPIDALKFCLDTEDITLDQVKIVAVGMDWKYRNMHYGMPNVEKDKYVVYEDIDWYLPTKEFGSIRPPVLVIKHHLAHAATAYRLSGFNRCAILVIDNRGEDSSTSLGYGHNGKITFFRRINIYDSLGIFYDSAARYSGLYGKHREVGKFMGLASYGLPNMDMPIDSYSFSSSCEPDSLSIYDAILKRKEILNDYFINHCYPFEAGNADEIMAYANFAASAQRFLENAILKLLFELKKVTNCESIVISGGVAQNCSANGRIEESGLFSNIFIPPFSSDAGVSVGAALEANSLLCHSRPASLQLRSASLGAAYTSQMILDALGNYSGEIRFTTESQHDIPMIISDKLANGYSIGWMQGRFEGGPRALGNRSILADPRKRSSLVMLNTIKRREMWRPIAPSVLKSYYSDYFSGSADNKHFMNIACRVHCDKQHLIPAVVHVDGTARPQVVTEEDGVYFDLIEAFRRRTGIPMICNTSFNTKGMPLVNTPNDALHDYLESGLDILVIENYIIYRK